jgi:hypothetical protein
MPGEPLKPYLAPTDTLSASCASQDPTMLQSVGCNVQCGQWEGYPECQCNGNEVLLP